MKKRLFIIQGIIQFFVGIGAVICGVLFILFPSGRLTGMPLSLLEGSPFSNFLIPGMILFLVNGIGQLWAGILSFKQHACSGHTLAVFGIGLIIWIFMQISMIVGWHWLQYTYFFFGVIETALAFLMRKKLAEEWQ
ncbi:hypothetical protein JW835_05660 [bacterium]|nr:hypothetical protein [bacterium]